METKTTKKRSTLLGEWSPYKPLTTDDFVVFNEANDSIHGMYYKPLLVAKQAFAGINYRFICDTSAPPAMAIWKSTLEVFKPLNGSAYVKKHSKPLIELSKQLVIDKVFSEALVSSLKKAKTLAKKQLKPLLYKAINQEFNGNAWPESIEQYIAYLTAYSELIPTEVNDKEYPDVWQSNNTKNGCNQKIQDLLLQFNWLINQEVTVKNKTFILRNYKNAKTKFDFSNWIDNFDSLWGEFLNTPSSFTPKTIETLKLNDSYNLNDSSEYEVSWSCFNDFFFRQLNGANPETGISPLRSVSAPNKNSIISSPADCTYMKDYQIDENGNIPEITLKSKHNTSLIQKLLDKSPYSNDFNGGTFAHYFLSPFDYHRFHTPVSGKILESKSVIGKAYLNVMINNNGEFDALDRNENNYEFAQTKGIVIIETKEIGKIAIVPLGMTRISPIHIYHLLGKNVCKGQEFGKFAFGGSDVIVLFEKNHKLQLMKFDNDTPIHFKYGEVVATWE
ncbi:phosphatidylserine decarboxylase [Tenacibaculum sp. MAR_2009_124]|uniref:phosphatidylserine decarboxylase n=1 Tax=Tenacibaculum sp. MAR_2009_124 TaxID=1250059 RepID=UPI0015A05EB0|nr:phosphatidylserine decarboxylase [Tenacibaculum sp. MAR_2009_124]